MKFPEFENIFCIPCVSQYLHSTTRAEEAGLGLVSDWAALGLTLLPRTDWQLGLSTGLLSEGGRKGPSSSWKCLQALPQLEMLWHYTMLNSCLNTVSNLFSVKVWPFKYRVEGIISPQTSLGTESRENSEHGARRQTTPDNDSIYN